MSKRLVLIWIFLAMGMVASFQNCAGKGGFKSIQSESSLSTQCRAAIQSSAPNYKIAASELNCSDFNNYACERRIFSPDISDMSHSLKECLPDGQTCVDVDVREFNTSAARATASGDSAFAPGGEYNRQEVNCYHRMVYRGVPLFEGHADSLEEALAQALAACEKTQSRQESP